MHDSHWTPPDSLREFPAVVRIPIQWGDQDAIGHVNNIVPLRWIESARIAYFEKLQFDSTGRAGGLGFILASTRCDYRRQLSYPDEVAIGARVQRVGNTSLTFFSQVVSLGRQEIAVECESIVVLFDYPNQVKVPVSDALRAAIEQLEDGPARNDA